MSTRSSRGSRSRRHFAGSEVVESADPLAGVREAHREICRAMIDHQNAAEDRRHLLVRSVRRSPGLVDALTDAGWTREDSEGANVDGLVKGT